MKQVRKYLKTILKFLRVYGIDAVISLIMWSSPSWLSIWIPSLKPFALMWLGLMVSPILPMWIVVPLFAVIIHWIRKKIVQFIGWIKAQLNKVRMANELLVYFTVDEIELIRDKGKQMYKIKDSDTTEFRHDQDSKRYEMIRKDWEVRDEKEI